MTATTTDRYYVYKSRFNTTLAHIRDRSQKNDFNNDVCVSPQLPVEIATELCADYNAGRDKPPVVGTQAALDHYNGQYHNDTFTTAVREIDKRLNTSDGRDAIDLLIDAAIHLSFIELDIRPDNYYSGKVQALAKRIQGKGDDLHFAVFEWLCLFAETKTVIGYLFNLQVGI